jgi:hypothetical protein
VCRMEKEAAHMSRQTEIPGTEVPKNPDIELAIDAWLEAKGEQKYATDKTKIKHSALLIQMANAGIESYPFINPTDGKKKLLVVARDPKAKTTKAPRWNRREADRDDGDDVGEAVELEVKDDDAVDNKVEMRRVKRASVEKEIDPFASTRAAMDDDTESQAPAPAATPSKRKGRKKS